MTLPKDYQVHMLRIWQTSSADSQNKNALRVTIENTKTAVRVSFNDFDSLVTYLQQQVEPATA
ncbi:MAG: hypothetical protein GWP17_00595 [Aquificales bacterium]|nr:hypothetical protein [Aquificales bacterium]